MKVGVRVPNWLGDIAFNLPMVRALSQKYNVTIVTKESFRELFYGFETITFTSNKELYRNHASLKGAFDYYIVTPISFSSAFAAFLTASKIRVGFSFDMRDFLLTKRIKIPQDWKRKHTIETYFLLYSDLIHREDIKFNIEIPEFFRAEIENKLKSWGLSAGKYVSCAPFAQFGNAKEWHLPYLIELAKLLKTQGIKLVVLGSKGDQARSLELAHGNILNLTGKTSLWQAVYIAKNSVAFIGNDSGLTHMAALAGSNTIAIFGPTPVSWTKPLGPSVYVIKKDLPCAPCEKRQCPLNTKECMKLIKPEDIFELLRQFL